MYILILFIEVRKENKLSLNIDEQIKIMGQNLKLSGITLYLKGEGVLCDIRLGFDVIMLKDMSQVG